jgi:hypothetical protein
MTSDSLINVADRYIDLEMVKDDIRKIPRGSQPAYGYRSVAELGSPASLSAEA